MKNFLNLIYEAPKMETHTTLNEAVIRLSGDQEVNIRISGHQDKKRKLLNFLVPWCFRIKAYDFRFGITHCHIKEIWRNYVVKVRYLKSSDPLYGFHGLHQELRYMDPTRRITTRAPRDSKEVGREATKMRYRKFQNVLSLVVLIGFMSASGAFTQIPSGTLAPGDIDKFVLPLVKPPAIPPSTSNQRQVWP